MRIALDDEWLPRPQTRACVQPLSVFGREEARNTKEHAPRRRGASRGRGYPDKRRGKAYESGDKPCLRTASRHTSRSTGSYLSRPYTPAVRNVRERDG